MRPLTSRKKDEIPRFYFKKGLGKKTGKIQYDKIDISACMRMEIECNSMVSSETLFSLQSTRKNYSNYGIRYSLYYETVSINIIIFQ